LEEVVREAAAEYERLIECTDLMETLRHELHQLRERITILESEVARLRKA
jgi:polyhydroxyalkanoate synthesis regulator phasin